jgi:hypothetical protein
MITCLAGLRRLYVGSGGAYSSFSVYGEKLEMWCGLCGDAGMLCVQC